ncbi:MAG: hypothetical protein Q8930_09685, partial [Bacillota bacterium]|nr:hypothetical protein [Bacillota bacterium]
MLYRVQVKRYKNYGFFLGIMVSLLFLVGITVYGFNALFLNKNNDTFSNSVLYAQVLNSSMPILKVTSFEEEDVSEDRDSIKGEFMKLLGMNVNNPVSIIGREVSLLKSTGVDTELPDTSGTGSIAKVDPFAPTPGMVSTTNQGTPG